MEQAFGIFVRAENDVFGFFLKYACKSLLLDRNTGIFTTDLCHFYLFIYLLPTSPGR